MDAEPAPRRNPLLVIALGGNALSPPGMPGPGYLVERRRIAAASGQLATLASRFRLLVVHGNGPQIGRLMGGERDATDFDIHTAQTQGELGYLIAQHLPGSVVLVTRVVVEAEPGPPVKAIGSILPAAPPGIASTRVAGGFRILVPSPRPLTVVELPALSRLLADHHVIAGGGGGIALDEAMQPVAGVVDKDRTALLLAIGLGADALVFATDVAGVFTDFGTPAAYLLRELDTDEAESRLRRGELPAGSMAPKVESAVAYARSTARPAIICHLDEIEAAVRGDAGTRIPGCSATTRPA